MPRTCGAGGRVRARAHAHLLQGRGSEPQSGQNCSQESKKGHSPRASLAFLGAKETRTDTKTRTRTERPLFPQTGCLYILLCLRKEWKQDREICHEGFFGRGEDSRWRRFKEVARTVQWSGKKWVLWEVSSKVICTVLRQCHYSVEIDGIFLLALQQPGSHS